MRLDVAGIDPSGHVGCTFEDEQSACQTHEPRAKEARANQL